MHSMSEILLFGFFFYLFSLILTSLNISDFDCSIILRDDFAGNFAVSSALFWLLEFKISSFAKIIIIKRIQNIIGKFIFRSFPGKRKQKKGIKFVPLLNVLFFRSCYLDSCGFD